MFQRGKVLFFNPKKRFGFIKPDGGCPRDIYFQLRRGGGFVIDARYGVTVKLCNLDRTPRSGDVVYYKTTDRDPTKATFWGYAESYYNCYRALATDGSIHTVEELIETKTLIVAGLMMPDELHRGRVCIDGPQRARYNTGNPEEWGCWNGVLTGIAV